MIKKILVATDGSDTAVKAGTFAIELASQLNASIYALYVADAIEFLAGMKLAEMYLPTRDIIIQQLEEEGKAAISRLEDIAKAKGVSFSGEVVKGNDPVEEIVSAANKESADLIVVGSHGKKTSLLDIALGEIPPKLLSANVPCPVTVVKK
ncbi:MAG: universal stress protein [Thermodesulfobacteria bacterium]|nr:universal stress protein [Thermodesulfobacteriota bacterium]